MQHLRVGLQLEGAAHRRFGFPIPSQAVGRRTQNGKQRHVARTLFEEFLCARINGVETFGGEPVFQGRQRRVKRGARGVVDGPGGRRLN